jgi:hypothetical protein
MAGVGTGVRANLAALWPWLLAADVLAWLLVVHGVAVLGAILVGDAVPDEPVYTLLIAVRTAAVDLRGAICS